MNYTHIQFYNSECFKSINIYIKIQTFNMKHLSFKISWEPVFFFSCDNALYVWLSIISSKLIATNIHYDQLITD